MGGGIYRIDDDDRLVEMTEQAYESEERLQEWIEQYPNLLAGDRPNNEMSRRWLLVSRENSTANEEEGTQRWSRDRLFLDRLGIPTFVEVKRLNSERCRQEAIGQMLDYAANAIVHWPIEQLVAQFEANCREQGRDPEQVFEEFFGADADEEAFWQQVKTNLQAGKIRLVFVADEIPVAARRVVEFLNEQMDPAEILAVEIEQYTDVEADLRVLVPRTIGQTAGAKQKKASATLGRRKWDESSFFQELKSRRGKEEAIVAKKLYQWAVARSNLLDVQWGTGDTYGGFSVCAIAQSSRPPYDLFRVGIWGGLEISSRDYASREPFDTKDKWQELREQLSSIGMALPNDPREPRFPFLRLSTLQDEQALERGLQIFEWIAREIQGALKDTD
ncbi:hypothetical protein IQ235_15135 [Oscillatoriales cyanobacterium LEGE 11467]|uniref:DUF4268 domain-containing protein n=1 Tax=Zarconia navalis LEGE 11467 TaxID=1828826 RepID=A0A928Z9W7_9CYAN|nr:hypothetical protein [Zarconia navalis]MBE9042113.1 hypothetical protein [Zarconia navalis LEGE 11467]